MHIYPEHDHSLPPDWPTFHSAEIGKDISYMLIKTRHVQMITHRFLAISRLPCGLFFLTFIAFFMNFTLSFSMSRCFLMGFFSSSSTTMPGPCVQGPPANSMILAPVFGNVHCNNGTQLVHYSLLSIRELHIKTSTYEFN